MAPMATPPSDRPQPATAGTLPPNPVSLLWGHQLKREHGFLLDRMNKLENEHQGYNARIRSAEVAVTTVKSTAQDIKRLERSLSAIDESDRHRSAWIESAEPRLAKLQEDIDKGKKVQPRVSALEGKYEDLEGEVQRLTSNQELAMGKIATLESNLQDSGAQKLIKKNDMNDVRALGQRLQALEALRKEERATARAMHDKIGGLEGDLQKYDSRNEQLRVRLETSLLTRDHPLPSSELPTGNLQSSSPGYVQVPASPQYGLRGRIAIREESPILNAQIRKTSRMVRDVRTRGIQSQQNAQIPESQQPFLPSETPDLDAPYRGADHAQFPNCSRKRKAAPHYEPRQTRSQARSQVPEEASMMDSRLDQATGPKKMPPRDSTGRFLPSQTSRLPKPNGDTRTSLEKDGQDQQGAARKLVANNGGQRTAPQRAKRRRRKEIEQPEDLESFLAACPF